MRARIRRPFASLRPAPPRRPPPSPRPIPLNPIRCASHLLGWPVLLAQPLNYYGATITEHPNHRRTVGTAARIHGRPGPDPDYPPPRWPPASLCRRPMRAGPLPAWPVLPWRPHAIIRPCSQPARYALAWPGPHFCCRIHHCAPHPAHAYSRDHDPSARHSHHPPQPPVTPTTTRHGPPDCPDRPDSSPDGPSPPTLASWPTPHLPLSALGDIALVADMKPIPGDYYFKSSSLPPQSSRVPSPLPI